MDSILRNFSQMMNAALLLTVILAGVASGIALLLLFLLARRAWRHFRVWRFDALSIKIHGQWREIVRGEIPAQEWRKDSMQCEIVQSIVIQEISAATDKDRAGLQEFSRNTGRSIVASRECNDVMVGLAGGPCWRSAQCVCRRPSLRFPRRS